MVEPKQTPGNNTGNNTPNDAPTAPPYNASKYKKTLAVSEFTGIKSGSKNVYDKKIAKPAVKIPENKRCRL